MQRRLLVPVVAAVLLALIGLGMRAGVVAQDATPTPDHPLIGTWIADTDLEDPDNPQDAFLFTADGGFVEIDANGDQNLGAWEATGATTANLTIVTSAGDDEGANFGTVVIRASFEVGADGDSFTGEFTIEFIEPDGTTSGEAGPGQVSGERLTVEAPGTPTTTLEELFSQFEGTPEATPEL